MDFEPAAKAWLEAGKELATRRGAEEQRRAADRLAPALNYASQQR